MILLQAFPAFLVVFQGLVSLPTDACTAISITASGFSQTFKRSIFESNSPEADVYTGYKAVLRNDAVSTMAEACCESQVV
jgi:hypothetical protein